MKTKLIFLALMALAMSGCSSTQLARKFNPNSMGYRVTVYPPDHEPIVYITKQVYSESDSDGWYFTNEKTKKTVMVGGTVIIEDL